MQMFENEMNYIDQTRPLGIDPLGRSMWRIIKKRGFCICDETLS